METLIITLKFNNYKFENIEKLQNQIRKICNYLIIRKKLNSDTMDFRFGTVNDDFVKNKKTLKITYNLKK